MTASVLEIEAQLDLGINAAHVPAVSVGQKIRLGIDNPEAELLVRVGPLSEGGAERVLDSSALGNLPPILERLTSQRRVESYERRLIVEALQKSGGKVARAADLLGISRTNLHNKMAKHRLS